MFPRKGTGNAREQCLVRKLSLFLVLGISKSKDWCAVSVAMGAGPLSAMTSQSFTDREKKPPVPKFKDKLSGIRSGKANRIWKFMRKETRQSGSEERALTNMPLVMEDLEAIFAQRVVQKFFETLDVCFSLLRSEKKKKKARKQIWQIASHGCSIMI